MLWEQKQDGRACKTSRVSLGCRDRQNQGTSAVYAARDSIIYTSRASSGRSKRRMKRAKHAPSARLAVCAARVVVLSVSIWNEPLADSSTDCEHTTHRGRARQSVDRRTALRDRCGGFRATNRGRTRRTFADVPDLATREPWRSLGCRRHCLETSRRRVSDSSDVVFRVKAESQRAPSQLQAS